MLSCTKTVCLLQSAGNQPSPLQISSITVLRVIRMDLCRPLERLQSTLAMSCLALPKDGSCRLSNDAKQPHIPEVTLPEELHTQPGRCM